MKRILPRIDPLALVLLAGLLVVGYLNWMRISESFSEVQERQVEGPEVGLTFLVSSTCTACQLLEKDLIEGIRDAVAEEAHERGWGFVMSGVAVDASVTAGMNFLTSLGDFDEISVGRRWMNQVSVEYTYGRNPGPAAVPQVIVTLQSSRESLGVGRSLSDRVVILRKVGLDELWRWSEAGFPFSLAGIDAPVVPSP